VILEKSSENRIKMNGWRKIFCAGATSVVLLLSAVLFCGCVSKSKAQARAQQAYLAGQNAALRQQQVQPPGVTVIGPVQNPDVPWVEGLTLRQAIATANYLGQRDPKEIVITRQGQSAKLAPKMLLIGSDVPLEPGDTITIHE
jgi:protein involved in polysaccharide export with SLBB domain